MSPTRQWRSRRTLQWPIVAWLVLVWIMMWGSLSPTIVLGGVVVAFAVLVAFPLPPIAFDGKIRPLQFVVLVTRFAGDLVAASLHVVWLSIRPAAVPLGAVIQIDLRSRSELYLTITAELISLVPGSLVIEVSRTHSRLYLHILAAKDPAGVEKARAAALAQERRVVEALGSEVELAQYRANVEEST